MADRCPLDFVYLDEALGASSPKEIRFLLDAFWEGARETTDVLAGLVKDRNLAGLKLAAHSAKGAALYIGAVVLSEALDKLEKLAAKMDLERCEEQVSRVAAEFSRVEDYLEAKEFSE